MAKQVKWNKYIYDRFCELAMLSDLESEILKERIKGVSIVQSSFLHGMSESGVNNIIRQLKEKYDNAQKIPGSNLPVRKKN
ncbi:MAG: hypothetical protein MJ197_10780 [Bacteroidales bacterium]|nr:hypothetical protein [Bacteroidales bacterium]